MTDAQLADTIRTQGFRRVRIHATVTLDAYVLDPDSRDDAALTERIRDEIEDAVRYRAPHLTDTEDGDALITLTDPHPQAVTVEDITPVPAGDTTAEQVADLARCFAAEVF